MAWNTAIAEARYYIKIQEEANAKKGEVEPTDPTAPNIIEGSGTATSTINDENKKKENQTV